MAVLTVPTNEYTQDGMKIGGAAPWVAQRLIVDVTLKILKFTLPAVGTAGSQNSLVYLRHLPSGLVWFFPLQSQWACNAWGANCTVNFGFAAYKSIALATVAASASIFDSGASFVSAGQGYFGTNFNQANNPNLGMHYEFSSEQGVDLVITCAGTGGLPSGAQLTGYLQIGIP
jgi:hypothetical protein